MRPRLLICFVFLLAFSVGCKDSILSDCSLSNTGEVYFVNSSATGKTYDVIWDGAKMATIGPGQTSQTFTVSAVVSHSMVFRIAGTSQNACSPSTVTIPKCQKWNYSCSL